MRFLSLAVSYSQLVQFSLETAHNSVRKAIADLCNVSPLRVVDIHVSIALSCWATLHSNNNMLDSLI